MMLSQPDLFHYPVHLSGRVATRSLQGTQTGRVAAVFRSSFYVETVAGFACIGHETLEAAPLNLITGAPAGTNWSASGVRNGDEVYVCPRSLDIGRRFSFLLSGATNWRPAPLPKAWKLTDLKQGLDSFREAASNRVPNEGLGRLLHPTFRPEIDNPVSNRAWPSILEARKWLSASMATPDKRCPEPHWVHPLIGLGPGLTPSGDDFISGILIALHCLEKSDLRKNVWMHTSKRAKSATTPISCAHLEAASQGEGSEGIHQALTTMMTGQAGAIGEVVRRIDRIGHTSGWDAIAGVVTVFDAWFGSHCPLPQQEVATVLSPRPA